MRRFAIITALITALALPAAAAARPGDLDARFSGDGLVSGADLRPATALAIAADGAPVIAGQNEARSAFALKRYEPDGPPSWTHVLPGTGVALEAEPAGTLVAGGALGSGAQADFVLSRFNAADGSAATSLGGTGSVVTDFNGGEDKLTDVAVGADGSIAAAGIVSGPEGDHLGVARYTASGGPLPGFSGPTGTWTAPEGGGFGTDASVLVLADGSTLVAGAGPDPEGSGVGDVLVVKLTATGGYDPAFGGGDGWVTIDVDGRDDARSLALAGDGHIVVGFQACAFGLHTSCDGAVARLTPTGQLDPAFGAGGIHVGLSGFEVVPGPDGGVLVAGVTDRHRHFQRDFALTALHADGTIDSSFSGGGTARADFGLTEDLTAAVAVGPDGRPVVAGGVDGDRHGIARFGLADGPPDADADGRLDDADRCPQRYSRHKTGCPKVNRKLKLRKRGRKLEARLSAKVGPCESRQQVRLLRKKGKRWRGVKRRRTNRAGKAKLAARPRPGRYRAVVGASIAPELARCGKARSKRVRAR